MKKNILFHKFLTFISVFMLLSCFGIDKKNNKMAIIAVTNLNKFNTCIDCYGEVNEIIQSIEEIESYDIRINNEKTLILLHILHNDKKITLDQIMIIITSHGYHIELLNNKE